MTCNDHLITVLDRMHGSQVDQTRWVRDDSGFDNTSKRVMLELVEGQRTCVDRFRRRKRSARCAFAQAWLC